MASPISIKELKKMPKIAYADVRNTLKTGDLVFCAGEYTMSQLIRKVTNSTFSHVGMIYKDEELDRILILESELFYGVRIAPFSKYFKSANQRNRPYKGIVVVASPSPEAGVNFNDIIKYGMDSLTRPYNNEEVLNIFLRMFFNVRKSRLGKKYICSEYVYDCFKKTGYTFSVKEKSITPKTIWEDERIHIKCRLL